MNESYNWVGVAALALSLLLAVIGILRRPTFMPMSVVVQLRQEVKELNETIARLRMEVVDLNGRIGLLITERDYYSAELRKLRLRGEC